MTVAVGNSIWSFILPPLCNVLIQFTCSVTITDGTLRMGRDSGPVVVTKTRFQNFITFE